MNREHTAIYQMSERRNDGFVPRTTADCISLDSPLTRELASLNNMRIQRPYLNDSIRSGQRRPQPPSAHRTVRTGPYTAPHVRQIDWRTFCSSVNWPLPLLSLFSLQESFIYRRAVDSPNVYVSGTPRLPFGLISDPWS